MKTTKPETHPTPYPRLPAQVDSPSEKTLTFKQRVRKVQTSYEVSTPSYRSSESQNAIWVFV